MDKLLPTLIILAILIVVFVLMRRSWLRRTARDAALPAGYPVVAGVHRELACVSGLYVVTTEHDRPLDRLAIAGLAFRGHARIDVTDDGVTITVTGEAPVYLPAQAIDSVSAATAAIDRVVEPGGLVKVAWRLDPAAESAAGALPTGRVVDSYFRIVDQDDHVGLIDAMSHIQPDATGSQA